MILFFLYTHDAIQKAVKLETSLLAVRRDYPIAQNERTTGKDYTNNTFDLLVLDREQDILFKRLFEQAHAEVIKRISSNYLAHTPTDMENVLREFPDFRQDTDFALWLNIHHDFPLQYRKSIDIKIEQFLIDYICWRWFETKLPNDAKTYKERLETTMTDVQQLLIRTGKPIRRYPSFP